MVSKLLSYSWARMWDHLGAQGNTEKVRHSLCSRYNEGHRYYHNLGHVQECLENLGRVILPPLVAAELTAAVWFHDSVYDVRRGDNEEQSAQLAAKVLQEARVAHTSVVRIVAMIRSTDHDPAQEFVFSPVEETLNRRVGRSLAESTLTLLDIDLAILGATERRFEDYERGIRREYDHVPTREFIGFRRKLYEGFLSRRQIYRTPAFFGRYEESARANLRRSLDFRLLPYEVLPA